MDLNSALDIIIKDLREAREIIDDLRNIKGVPAIQVELAKAKCKSAEDIISLLKTAGNEFSVSARPVTEETPVETIPQEMNLAGVEQKKAVSDEAATEKVVPEKVIPETVAPETVMVEKTEPEKVSPVTTREKKSVGKSREQGKPILADKYSEIGDRVNEKMGSRSDDDITSRLKQSRITNLDDAIGVNDRFYLIRELFSGNREVYNTAIERLNSASVIDEAEQILNELSSPEGDPAARQSLLDLVKRKTGLNG
ncbi:MAG: hypothetical protein RBS37_06655 [Bacteroidales bacterium]|jgi:hypothetical protein|nr:hypothetical protein [Bacteroidales bacterium]